MDDQTPRELDAWQYELAVLTDDPSRLVFQDGVPSSIESSLEPHRSELEALNCRAAAELEVVQTVETGAWYDHR